MTNFHAKYVNYLLIHSNNNTKGEMRYPNSMKYMGSMMTTMMDYLELKSSLCMVYGTQESENY